MIDQNHFNEECIVSAVLSFINAKTWAKRKVIGLAHHNDLLTPEAFQVFEALLMQYKDDENATLLLEDHCSLLLRCQSDGIETSFADRLQLQSLHNIPSELLARLRSMHSENKLCEIIEEHFELLSIRALGKRCPEINGSGSRRVRSKAHFVNVKICRSLLIYKRNTYHV